MILLHLLLAVAFALLAYNHLKLNQLRKAFKTQGQINEVTKEAFESLTTATAVALDGIDKELAKKANKRVSKKK